MPFPIAADVYYTNGQKCTPSASLVGLLVIDHDRLVVRDDQGVMTSVTWRGSLRARGAAGGEVEIVDGWTVVARSGQRYELQGGYEPSFHGFWACADIIELPD